MRCQPSQAELAHEIGALRFALIDLGLYLDTHPACEGALKLYAEYNRAYKDACATYASLFGPLSMSDVGAGQGWTWGSADTMGEGGN